MSPQHRLGARIQPGQGRERAVQGVGILDVGPFWQRAAARLPEEGRGLSVALWGAQGVLAAAFIAAGATKLLTPADQLAAMIPWTAEHTALAPFTGLVDLAGGLGILLPSLTRIQPRLTVLAALGIILLQVLAGLFHISRGEGDVLPMIAVFIALAGFVAWGREKARPIAPRA